MCVGALEAADFWLVFVITFSFGFSAAPSPPMARHNKSPQPKCERAAQTENWGRPSGGTDFLIAWLGGDFTKPSTGGVVQGNSKRRHLTNPNAPLLVLQRLGLPLRFRRLGLA